MFVTDELAEQVYHAYCNGALSGPRGMKEALTAALASMWRPVEEARGVVVSCYSSDSYGPRIIAFPGRGGGVVAARWWQHLDGACNFLDDGGDAIFPEVFMPLPAPPVQQKERV